MIRSPEIAENEYNNAERLNQNGETSARHISPRRDEPVPGAISPIITSLGYYQRAYFPYDVLL